MTETGHLDGLYSDIEEAAGLLDVTCPRDTVWPILTTYGEHLPQAEIAFRVATRSAKDLDARFLFPKGVDPYAMGLSDGITTAESEHPVGALYADIEKHLPTDRHGIDFGVVGGFKKTWTFFNLAALEKLSRIAEIPSMPRSLAENMSFYTRHGLDDKVSLIGIDYPNRTVNVYFLGAPAECREPETIRSMLSELGLPEPSEEMLKIAQRATGIYTTLSWDSGDVKRITFATLVPDLRQIAAGFEVEPEVETFAKNAPYTYDADRKGIYGVAASSRGEYCKLQSFYQLMPQMLNQLKSGPKP
jgi:6-linalyl-2-O,3-dimethylflaviolin/7-geranyloxy-5-hydroxy-2-methoxy-3-methylnaphthalene-1,4-dione synthase